MIDALMSDQTTIDMSMKRAGEGAGRLSPALPCPPLPLAVVLLCSPLSSPALLELAQQHLPGQRSTHKGGHQGGRRGWPRPRTITLVDGMENQVSQVDNVEKIGIPNRQP